MNKVTRDKKTEGVNTLTAEAEQLTADIAKLTQEVADLNAEVLYFSKSELERILF